MENALYRAYYESPLGIIDIAANDMGVTSVSFASMRTAKTRNNKHTEECASQLHDYFNKTREQFSVSLDLHGTDFQKKVWNELICIPYGQAISYLQLAIRLGDRKCIRAAGTANGKNPVAIIIPCHRVIGADGDLTGYAGGLDKKKFLLEHEGVLVQQELFV